MASEHRKCNCEHTEKMWRRLSLTLLIGIFINFIQENSYGLIFLKNMRSAKILGFPEVYLLESQTQDNGTLEASLEDTSRIVNTEKAFDDYTLPLFEFFPNILGQEDALAIKTYVHNNGLGPDPSSSEFIEREKNIRFIRVDNGDFVASERDYFIQPATYNDFSGGYKRYYNLIPNNILMGPMRSVILHFVKYHQLSQNTTILVQLQSSIIQANSTKSDVTGQGIHTDGTDDAMLICVERDNVIGAENEFHAALDGSQPLSKPRILEAGDGVVFRDNTIYHHVTDAKTNVEAARRTLILMHSPDGGDGDINPNNNQGTNSAKVQLRNQHT